MRWRLIDLAARLRQFKELSTYERQWCVLRSIVSQACAWWDSVSMPMEVRSLPHGGCVFACVRGFVCRRVRGQARAGNWRSYINSPGREDGVLGLLFFVGWGLEDGTGAGRAQHSCVLTDGFLHILACVCPAACANGCIVPAGVGGCGCGCVSLRDLTVVSFGMCVCASVPVNVAWARRSDTQGLCPCFPVNTLFFFPCNSGRNVGQIGGLLLLHHPYLLLFIHPPFPVFFSLRLVL